MPKIQLRALRRATEKDLRRTLRDPLGGLLPQVLQPLSRLLHSKGTLWTLFCNSVSCIFTGRTYSTDCLAFYTHKEVMDGVWKYIFRRIF